MIKDSLLWRIQTSSGNHSSFIFGTIHLHCQSSHNFLLSHENIIENVQCVYTESELDQQISPSHFYISEDRSLVDLLGEKKYIKIKKVFRKAFNFDIENHNRLLPLLLVQNLSLICQRVENQPSVDAQIFQLAIRNGKQIRGIESMKEQLEILEKIPLNYQVKSLIKIASNVNSFRKSLDRLVEMYENQRIVQLFKSSKKHLGPIRKVLLYERNLVMADRIAEFHSEESALFTFGAGHLAGNHGVLALLKRKGLKLKPLTIDKYISRSV